MAEIRIRKKKSMAWVWILVILVILAAIVIWAITTNKISLSQNSKTDRVIRSEQALLVKQKSITQVPGIVSLKLEAYIT